MRTMLAPGSARLLAEELSHAKVNIMALQEVRWSDAGETTDVDYHYLWSGPPEGQPHQGGIALALDRASYQALTTWHPINSQLLVANFRHSFGKFSIVAVHAPTDEASDHEKDAFYARLEQVLSLTHRNNLLLCLGDFNAVSGTDRSSVVGPAG